MGWLEDVRNCIEQLPLEFQLGDIDPFLPRLHRLHPRNNHLREKVRQQLQELRDLGEITFLGAGNYRRASGADGGLPIKPGQMTSRDELAEILGMKGAAALQRGMFKRATGPFANDLLLFHHADNQYGDSIHDDERILYVGQGQKEGGDQKIDGHNLALASHLENGTRVHFFVKEGKAGSDIRYEGQVVLDRVERVFREEESRSVLEFHLIPDWTGAARAEFGRAFHDILEEPLEPHVVERPQTVQVVRRALRDKAFASQIREIYRNQCAACGDVLAHPEEKWVDLQGAHVRAVSAGGPDARNNGLALCSRHHWAFDHGIFSLTDDYELILHPQFSDSKEELIAGAAAATPDDIELAPHAKYLEWHRSNWRLT